VLLDDQRAPERNHQQDSHHAADDRDDRHLGDAQVVSHEQDGGQSEHDARRDRLAGGAGRLHDVVLEDRGPSSVRKKATDSTAIGIDADTSTDLEREMTLEAAKTRPSRAPRIRARAVSSAGLCCGGTNGANVGASRDAGGVSNVGMQCPSARGESRDRTAWGN